MYFLVLAVLGVTLLACVGAWIALALLEKPMPDGLSALTTLVAGGLLGVLAPTNPASGRDR